MVLSVNIKKILANAEFWFFWFLRILFFQKFVAKFIQNVLRENACKKLIRIHRKCKLSFVTRNFSVVRCHGVRRIYFVSHWTRGCFYCFLPRPRHGAERPLDSAHQPGHRSVICARHSGWFVYAKRRKYFWVREINFISLLQQKKTKLTCNWMKFASSIQSTWVLTAILFIPLFSGHMTNLRTDSRVGFRLCVGALRNRVAGSPP